MMMLILRVEIEESMTVGIWMSFEDKSRYFAIDLSIIYEKSKGVPQLLHLHDILVLSPNLRL